LNDGAVWPFDAGQGNFIILNLAIGGDYPGPPNSSTPFPSEMLLDYVRVYTNLAAYPKPGLNGPPSSMRRQAIP
jgi:beta-glucanase (GH16 family)